MQAAGSTDTGRVRAHNEDAFVVQDELGLYVVADGMGGHRAGDVASAMVSLSLSNFFEATRCGDTPPEFLEDGDDAHNSDTRRLVAAVRKANRDVHLVSRSNGNHFGMGSTVVAAHWREDAGTLAVAHVGDSRCYQLRSDSITQLTHDHSILGELLAARPELSETELSMLPNNIITRALGLKARVTIDIAVHAVHPGDAFVLCSDGLSGMIRDEEILEAVSLMGDARQSAELLVQLANEAGGVDNVTAVVLQF